MNKLTVAKNIKKKLYGLGLLSTIQDSGSSVYLLLKGSSKFKQIRVSNHNGHKSSKKCLQVRSDACTHRKSGIFNIKDVKSLIELVSKSNF